MDLHAIYETVHSLWVVWAIVFFVAIVAWTFWPSHKKRLEDYGRIPLDDDET